MGRLLIVLLIVVPALEIWGLVTVGSWIGALPTVGAVIATGILGGWLARKEGLAVLNLARLQLQQGQIPGEAILDGISILAGGLLLLTPGFFTDAIGFFLLLPYTRGMIKLLLKRKLMEWFANGRIVWIGNRKP